MAENSPRILYISMALKNRKEGMKIVHSWLQGVKGEIKTRENWRKDKR